MCGVQILDFGIEPQLSSSAVYELLAVGFRV